VSLNPRIERKLPLDVSVTDVGFVGRPTLPTDCQAKPQVSTLCEYATAGRRKESGAPDNDGVT